MIQDILPHVMHNEFVAGVSPTPESPVFHFKDNKVLLKVENEALVVATLAELGAPKQLERLFAIDETDYFLALDDEIEIPEGFDYYSLRTLRNEVTEPADVMLAAFTAHHLGKWYQENRYCGKCGAPTKLADNERAIECSGCGLRVYPKIMPAVIIGVCDGDRILMTKYSNRPNSYYALVAGFNEIGEDYETTVKREVMEETGLRVKNVRYYKSQPWGIAMDILAGFYCDVDGDPTPKLDEAELKEATWFERGTMPTHPNNFSLTNEMIMTFMEGKEPKA